MDAAGQGRKGWARIKPVLLGMVVVILMVSVRVLVGSVSELSDGDEALARGDEAAALRHFEAAAHWYLPGSPVVDDALTRLWGVAEARADRGDRQGALAAYSALRGAVLASRSFYVPNADWLAQTNVAIADLWLSDPDAVWPDKSLSPEDQRVEAMASLNATTMPSAGWSGLAVFAFLGWVGGAIGFVMKGFDASGALQRRPALRWGGGVVLAFALWLIGMAQA